MTDSRIKDFAERGRAAQATVDNLTNRLTKPTLDELNARRDQLELAIADLLRAFERDAPGAVADGVHIERVREIGPEHGRVAYVEVSMSLMRRGAAPR